MSFRILEGDCREAMAMLDADRFDAIVCDPPYHLTAGKKSARIGTGFMGKKWDGGDVAFRPETWAAVLRVAKPGAYLLAFGGTRTFHRLTCAIEDGGFEIHDTLSWLYGSGFPKHRSKLKPAWEPIILARRSAKHATPLNIDACRIEGLVAAPGGPNRGGIRYEGASIPQPRTPPSKLGRWPANVVLDEEAAELLDDHSGTLHSGDAHVLRRGSTTGKGMGYGSAAAGNVLNATYGDDGGASRFFYTAKASRSEREAGLEHLRKRPGGSNAKGYTEDVANGQDRNRPVANHHPTVKPLDLMQWLCRLVTPKGGLILDPFCGSGTTGRAAVAEGFSFIGIEKEPEYAAIARARIADYAPLFPEDNAA